MKALGYVRVSTHEQFEKGVSIPNQKGEIRRFCKAYGFDLILFEDPGQSGKDLNRPGFMAMEEEIKAGGINLVIALDVDRISRRAEDALKVCRVWKEEHSVDIICFKESIDTRKDGGDFLFGLLAVIAQREREQIKARSVRGKRFKAGMGLWVFGGPTVPLGYTAIKGKLEIVPEEAASVRRLFELVLTGQSLSSVVRCLQREGMPTKRSGKWSRRTLRRIVGNSLYSGGRILVEGGEVVKAPPLITKEFQGRAKAMVRERSYKSKRLPRSGRLLAGLLTCWQCGEPLFLKSQYYVCKGRYTKKTCKSKYIPVARVEGMLWAVVKQSFSKLSLLEGFIRSGDKARRVELERKQKGAQKRLHSVKTRMQSAVRKAIDLDEKHFKAMLSEEIKTLEEQIFHLSEQERLISAELGELEEQNDGAREIVKAVRTQKIFEKLEMLPAEERRNAIDCLVKGEIKVNWAEGPPDETPLFLMWYNITRFAKWLKDKGFL